MDCSPTLLDMAGLVSIMINWVFDVTGIVCYMTGLVFTLAEYI